MLQMRLSSDHVGLTSPQHWDEKEEPGGAVQGLPEKTEVSSTGCGSVGLQGWCWSWEGDVEAVVVGCDQLAHSSPDKAGSFRLLLKCERL